MDYPSKAKMICLETDTDCIENLYEDIQVTQEKNGGDFLVKGELEGLPLKCVGGKIKS